MNWLMSQAAEMTHEYTAAVPCQGSVVKGLGMSPLYMRPVNNHQTQVNYSFTQVAKTQAGDSWYQGNQNPWCDTRPLDMQWMFKPCLCADKVSTDNSKISIQAMQTHTDGADMKYNKTYCKSTWSFYLKDRQYDVYKSA